MKRSPGDALTPRGLTHRKGVPVSKRKASCHDRAEAEWLKAKAVLLKAIEDLRCEAEADSGLDRQLTRVRVANSARWRAYRAWQVSVRLLGQRFGELTVIELAVRRKNGSLWRCRCDCGGIRVVRDSKLSCGEITHCGECHSPYRYHEDDFTGRRYGMLTVVRWASPEERNEPQGSWLCRCDCGNSRTVRGYRLLNAEITDCGCRPTHGILWSEMMGSRFGHLTVLKRAGHNPAGKVMWLCRCDCGTTVVKLGRDLRSGKLTACSRECTNTRRLTDVFAETREQTLSAGGRPCNRCGAPLRGANPVCRKCINAAEARAREEAYA